VVLHVELIEVCAVVQTLVFDVFHRRIELFVHVSLGLLGQEVDQLLVALSVVTVDVQYVGDELFARAVAQPVGGLVEGFADVA